MWKAYLFQFLSSLAFFGGVLIQFFTQWGKITFAQVMLLESGFMFWSFALEVPTGVVADRIGRKYSLAMGAGAYCLGAIAYWSVPDLRAFLLGELLMAAGVAFLSGADDAMLYDSLKAAGKEKRAKEFFWTAYADAAGTRQRKEGSVA